MSRDDRLRIAGSLAGLGSAFAGFGYVLDRPWIMGLGITLFFLSYIVDVPSRT